MDSLECILSNALQRFGFDCNSLQIFSSAECICTDLCYLTSDDNFLQFSVILKCILFNSNNFVSSVCQFYALWYVKACIVGFTRFYQNYCLFLCVCYAIDTFSYLRFCSNSWIFRIGWRSFRLFIRWRCLWLFIGWRCFWLRCFFLKFSCCCLQIFKYLL